MKFEVVIWVDVIGGFIMKKIALATAAAGLAFSPIAVSAAERPAAPASGEQDLFGTGLIVSILAAAAVVAGIIIIADDDDDEPVSA